MRNPNLNSLRAFDAAARHLNFRLAAEDLNITQGAVAQQVRKLEAELGLQLFDRLSRGLALTPQGETYCRAVRKGLNIIDAATRDMIPDVRQVVISVPPSFAAKWLVPRLAAFARAHPDIDLQIEASSKVINFASTRVLLAIRQGRPPFGKHLSTELLAPLQLCAVSAPELGDSIGPQPDTSAFAGYPLVQDSHRHWDDVLQGSHGLDRRRVLQLSQTALALDAAANGQGIALAPLMLAEADLATGRLVELWRDTGADQSGFYLVRPEGSERNAAVDTVIGWLLSQARP